MDKFISVISNGEFWVAIAVCFIFSFVIAVIAQDIWDNFWSPSDEEYDINDLEVIDLDIEVGDTVYDTLTRRVGIYCGDCLGQDDNVYGVVVVVLDSTHIHYYYPLISSLLKVQA